MEQYSRRQCLRIEGIRKQNKEKTEDVINLIKKYFAEADVDIPDSVLEKAYRTDSVCKDHPEQNIQGTIAKFKNFRSMFYKYWKNLKRGNACSNRPNKQLVKSFKKNTNSLIKHIKMESNDYVFANLNCKLRSCELGKWGRGILRKIRRSRFISQ